MQIDSISFRKKAPSGRYISIVFCATSIALSLLFILFNEKTIAIILLIVSTIFITIFSNSKNVFHISFLSGHYAFWFFPIVVTTYVGVDVSYSIAFWCLIGIVYVIILTDNHAEFVWRDDFVSISPSLFSSIYILSVLALFASHGGAFVWAIGVLIVSGALCMGRGGFFLSSLVYASLVLYTMLYYVIYWSGFGRLVVIGVLMTITFMYLIRMGWSSLLKPMVMIVVPFGALIGSLVRANFSSINDVIYGSVGDSAVSPILLASDIHELRGVHGIIDSFGWIDQFILFFLALFPRSLWESKPNGFGFQYTIDNMPQSFVDSGHSIAATFIGEHIYYLGNVFGIVATFFILSIFIIIYRIISNRRIMGGYGIFVLALWVPTYYWGGMQAFSARFLISCVPLVFFLGVYRVYISVRRERQRPTRVAPRDRLRR